MKNRSRRGFLKAASATAAALAVSRHIPAWSAEAGGAVKVWGTFRDRRHAALDPLAWKPAGQIAADAIALNQRAASEFNAIASAAIWPAGFHARGSSAA